MKILVKLKAVHARSGLSQYSIAKDTGISINTVKRYIGSKAPDAGVEVSYIPIEVIALCKHYGVDWRDPAIVEVIEADDEDETEAPLAIPA